jgi:hypothetical protein
MFMGRFLRGQCLPPMCTARAPQAKQIRKFAQVIRAVGC